MRQNNIAASAWVFVGSSFFVVVGALVKLIGEAEGEAISIAQILLVRQATMMLFLLPLLSQQGLSAFHTRALSLQMLRVLLATIALCGSFWALMHLPLADVTVIGFSKVMFVTVAAWLFLSEQVGIRRIMATLVGFVGVVIILDPGGDAFNIYGLAALIAAACAGLAMIVIRKLSQYDSPQQLILYQATCLGLLALPLAVYFWVWPTLVQWGLLIGIGIASYCGQFCNVTGYSRGDASFIAPIDYFRLLGAAMIGYWGFGEVPSWNTAVGAALIVGAALYTLARELKRKREINATPAKPLVD